MMDEYGQLVSAIDSIRDELPALVGSDWPEFERELDDYTVRLRAGPPEAALAKAQVLSLFGRYREAHRRLISTLAEVGGDSRTATEVRGVWPDRHAPETTERSPDRGGTLESLRVPADQNRTRGVKPKASGRKPTGVRAGSGSSRAAKSKVKSVTRYTDIVCPRRVWIGTPRIAVVVRLTVRTPKLSAAVSKIEVDRERPVRVAIQAPGFDLLSGQVQEVTVPADADSDPVVFDLKPSDPGATQVTLDFFQGSEPIGTASVPVEITTFMVSEGADLVSTKAIASGNGVEPPDMVLHIAVQGNPRALDFHLDPRGGCLVAQLRTGGALGAGRSLRQGPLRHDRPVGQCDRSGAESTNE